MPLTVICGPMFASKSTTLYHYVADALRAKKTVEVFVPAVDFHSFGQVVTHSGMSLHELGITPHRVVSSRFIYSDTLDKMPDLLVIDEAQFFDMDLPMWVGKILQRTNIVAAGLDLTSEGSHFPGPMGGLLCLADKVKKMTAVCSCGTNATRTACLVTKTGAVMVGGDETYVPMCLRCWETHRLRG